jgi:hypothetical protein
VDCPILIEDDSEEEVREESRSVEIQEVTWVGGCSVPSVHTLYTIED